jgi:polyhydroxybutyrate depolymerase
MAPDTVGPGTNDTGSSADTAPSTPQDASSHDGTANASTGCGKTVQTGDQLLSIDVRGTTRTYLLTVPNGYTPSTPQPAYFVFHGRGGDHSAMTGYGMQDTAIGVFPDGLVQAGAGASGWDTSLAGIDVAMFDAVLASVEASTCVDQGRVYAAGFSWGASMANTLGCARGNVLKAFASVEGGILFSETTSACRRPVPGWINQYQQDPTVSYATGLKAEEFFISLNGSVNPVPYDAPNPCVQYSGLEPLVWCTPSGTVHQWPDYATAAMKRFFGTL